MKTLRANAKRRHTSTLWLTRQLNDPFVLEAKKKGYRARAAFKLLQVQEQYSIIKKNDVVVDLGAAPGSWCQIAATIAGKEGAVIGLDLLAIDPMPDVQFLQGDFREEASLQALHTACNGRPVNVVLSDMAPNTTGDKGTDHLRIMVLCEQALDFAVHTLAPGGHFLAKVFQGGSEKEVLIKLKHHFKQVKHIKPAASRKESPELYVLALYFKGKQDA